LRTNIVIDDCLMNEVLQITGYETKKEAVEAGLKLLITMKKQSEIRKKRGMLKWEGNLDAMRIDR
jgi:Arc/MetJ family transcription regulator